MLKSPAEIHQSLELKTFYKLTLLNRAKASSFEHWLVMYCSKINFGSFFNPKNLRTAALNNLMEILANIFFFVSFKCRIPLLFLRVCVSICIQLKYLRLPLSPASNNCTKTVYLYKYNFHII